MEIQVRPGHPWVINMLPLESVDEASGVARTAVSATYAMSPLPGWVHNPSGSTVWIENILEALDGPGEWVVNTKTRKIYLWPRDPSPDGSPRGILAPSASELIRVEGAIDYDGPTDEPVRGIAFSGLTFTHADRWAWTTDDSRLGWGMQHDWDMFDRPTAMLRFRGAEGCSISACRFIDSGGTGLRLDLHAQRNRVEDCEFARLGEAGILLAGYGPGTKDVNHHNDIFNNTIHHFSEITWHSPGVWAWQSGHNRIAHNELHHSGYTAVLITTRVTPDRALTGEGGKTVRRREIAAAVKNRPRDGYENWRSRERYNHARHNLVEYNDISHSVQLLSDGNAIYISGTGTGNIIRYNFVHDNLAHSLPSAIRCDDDQYETLIHGNVLYNNYGFSAGIASKGVNDITNNFIVAPAAAPTWGYVSFEWVPVPCSMVHHNIIVSHPEGGNAYAERPRGEGVKPKVVETDMDSNLYYHPTDSHWMDAHLLKMRAAGKEMASRFGAPLFADPAGGDFSFRPGSPALALRIEPLDVSRMGYMKRPLSTCTRVRGLSGATAILAQEGLHMNRSWAGRLEYVGVAVEEPGYHVWGSSPVTGSEGETHLFVSRWPVKEGFGAWITHCEIARYASDSPEGPFAFQDVVLRGTDQNTWDRESPHNPTAQKVGDKHVLCYIANAGGGRKERVSSQRIGMLIADRPEGPWQRAGEDGLILSPPEDPTIWSYGSTVGVNNPALFAHPDGRYYLYYKAMREGDVRRMGVAIAETVGGPYVFHENCLTSNRTEIEDGYAFAENGKIHLLTTHNAAGAGYLWESGDGIHFGEPIVGFDKLERYLPKEALRGARTLRGSKFERPQILLQNGKPTHLYVASGVNVTGGSGSYSCVLRIHEPKP